MNEGDALIYIVDDDAAMRDSLSFLLDAAGWRSRAFASAQEFFDAYQRNVPGCLVLDVMMPLMGGLEVQRILRARAISDKTVQVHRHNALEKLGVHSTAEIARLLMLANRGAEGEPGIPP